jgi:ABC-type multidrug transport system fused ATPase/permease subunit
MIGYRKKMRTRILKQKYADFHGRPFSEYISILSQSLPDLENEYLSSISKITSLAVKAIGALVIMLYYNIWLTLLALVLAAAPLIIISAFAAKMPAVGMKIQESAGKLVGFHHSLFENKKDIKTAGRMERFSQKAAACDREYEEQLRNKDRLIQKIGAVGMLNALVSQLGIFLAGGWIALEYGTLTAGQVLIFVQLLNYLIEPVKDLPAVMAAGKSALEVIANTEESLPKAPEGFALPEDIQTISFENVDFSYPDNPVFHNLNLQFQKGRSYLILAPSGSGKSTLTKLLLGLLKPQSGQILYDKIPDQNLETDDILTRIGWMPQGYRLIEEDSTIVNFLQPDAKAESIPWDVSFASEERAVMQCSGGQKEKIYLSRIHLQDKPWMVLDEPVKSLDPNEQVKVMEELHKLQKSLIVIMHTDDERILSQFDTVISLKPQNIQISEQKGEAA